jgi:transposase
MIGLPSFETLDRAQVARIWLAAEATDMRYGFDRNASKR